MTKKKRLEPPARTACLITIFVKRRGSKEDAKKKGSYRAKKGSAASAKDDRGGKRKRRSQCERQPSLADLLWIIVLCKGKSALWGRAAEKAFARILEETRIILHRTNWQCPETA